MNLAEVMLEKSKAKDEVINAKRALLDARKAERAASKDLKVYFMNGIKALEKAGLLRAKQDPTDTARYIYRLDATRPSSDDLSISFYQDEISIWNYNRKNNWFVAPLDKTEEVQTHDSLGRRDILPKDDPDYIFMQKLLTIFEAANTAR